MARIILLLILFFTISRGFTQTDDVGAQIPFVILEAEESLTNAVIRSGRNDRSNPTYFASGRSLAELTSSEHYVRFTSPLVADRLTIRYSIPYNTSGNILLLINNKLVQEVFLESFRMWGGPNYPGDTNRRDGEVFRMFDEVIIEVNLAEGDIIELKKGDDTSIPSVLIDFIDLEKIPEPLSIPDQDWLNVTDFGILGTTQDDVSVLINNLLTQAASQSKNVWFPPGEYYIERAIRIPGNVEIMGAGMWHTIIRKKIPASRVESAFIMGTGNSISNMMIDDVLGYKRIGGKHYGIELGSEGIIDNVWVRNSFGAGIKGENIINTIIKNSRVYGSHSDAIHIKTNSKNCLIENTIIRNSGDDGLAMVSYAATGMENLHYRNNTVFFNYWGRGISMIGGNNCIIEKNLVIDGAAAGIVIGTNTFDGQATPFCTNFLIENNKVVRCGNVINQNQAGIWVWGNVAGSPLSGGIRYNTVIDPTRHCISLVNRVGSDVHVLHNYLGEPGPNGQKIYRNLTSGFNPTVGENFSVSVVSPYKPSKSSLKVFPNPFSSKCTVKWSNDEAFPYTLELYDMKGRLVKNENNLTGQEYILQRNGLPHGLYILKLKGKSQHIHRVLIN